MVDRVNTIIAAIKKELEQSVAKHCPSHSRFNELMVLSAVLLYKTSASDNQHVASEIQEMAGVLTDHFSLEKSHLLELLYDAMPQFKGEPVFKLPKEFLLGLSKWERLIIYSMAIRIAHADEQLRIGEIYFLSDLARALQLTLDEKKEARRIAGEQEK